MANPEFVRKKNKPPPPTIAALPGFKPNISDAQALHLVLNVATLTITQRLELGLLYGQIKSGIITQLGSGRRDQVIAILRAADMMPQNAPKRTRRQPDPPHAQDAYSAKRTEGTEFAERLLAAPIPAPPSRRRTA